MLYSSCWINLNLKKNFFSYLPIIEWFKASWIPSITGFPQSSCKLFDCCLSKMQKKKKKNPPKQPKTRFVIMPWIPQQTAKISNVILSFTFVCIIFFSSSRGITLCQKSLDLDQILVKYLNMQFQLYTSYTILKKLMSGNCKFHIFFYLQEAQLQKSSDLDQIRTWSVLSDKVPVNAISTLCMHSFKR